MTHKQQAWQQRKSLVWLSHLLALIVLLLVAGAVAGGIYQLVASANDRATYPPLGELVDVDGRQMHLYCIGASNSTELVTNMPTVVLESGLGDMLLNWNKVQAEAAKFVRVCAYDRAGFGWSEPADAPIHSPQVADTLHTLLKKAGETGPYLLVGHSVGGIHVRTFAHQYPDEVAGIVLVDSSHDNQRANDPDEGKNPLLSLCRAIAPLGIVRLLNLMDDAGSGGNPHLSASERKIRLAMMNQSHTCRATAHEEAAADTDMSQPTLKPLGNIPLIVLTATQTANRLADELPAELIEQVNMLWTEKQLELAALSTNSRQVMATESAHYIQYDQPELVVEAIRQMVTIVRSPASLVQRP